MTAVSANETTQNNVQNEIQQTTDTTTNSITANTQDTKTEIINKNINNQTIKTATKDSTKNIEKSSADNKKEDSSQDNTVSSAIAASKNSKLNISISIQKISAKDYKVFSGQNVTLTSKVTTEKDIEVNISTAILKINGKTVTKTNVTNGISVFNFIVPDLKEGKHIITLKTAETSLYHSAERNITITIYKRNVTITANNMTSYAGKEVLVAANVKSGNKNVLVTKAILKVAGKTVSKSTVINGLTLFKFTTPNLREGTYDMVIKTGTNTLYNGGSLKNKFTVYRNNLTLTANNLTEKAGKTVSLTAKFTSKSAKTINNIPAVIKINGTTITKTTIKNGVATFNFKIPALKRGTYKLLIKTGDSTFYNGASLTNKLTVYAQNITITANEVQAYAGENVNLVANFVSTDKTKANIANSVIKLNGKTLTNKAVVNGVANYSFTVPNVSAGKYNLTIISGDTTLYNSATKTTTLTVLENPK